MRFETWNICSFCGSNLTERVTKEFADYKPDLMVTQELSCENDNIYTPKVIYFGMKIKFTSSIKDRLVHIPN
jgi:exonuclease III